MSKKNAKSDTDNDPDSISMEAARELIFTALHKVQESETITCNKALGRIVAEPVVSNFDVPPFRASAMDGYAFRYDEHASQLRIAQQSLAGHPSKDDALANECHRITTGARVPDFADTVVQQENVSINEQYLTIDKVPERGFHVRQPGSDSTKGQTLMQPGQRLGASQLAVLGSHGITKIQVTRKIKIALFSTGDELVNPGEALPPGSIYESNRILLTALLGSSATEIIDIGIVKDSHAALADAMRQCSDADMVISSGGVSVGDADFVRPVLEQSGKLHMWKIAMKPGRPLTFGVLPQSKPYFGLPGNPVSSAVTCMMFVVPAIKQLLSQTVNELPRLPARLQTTLTKLPGRVEYQRGVLTRDDSGNWLVGTTGLQDSHVITSLHEANCFVELNMDSRGAAAGETVAVIPFELFADSPV